MADLHRLIKEVIDLSIGGLVHCTESARSHHIHLQELKVNVHGRWPNDAAFRHAHLEVMTPFEVSIVRLVCFIRGISDADFSLESAREFPHRYRSLMR